MSTKTLKMKKTSLFLGMIAFIAFTTSCETDTVEQDNQDFQIKSGGFNAEDTYYSILDNTESGMDQFDALTNSQKQDVWVFKYIRFKTDNELNGSQEEVVDDLLSYISEVDFTEGNETLEDELESDVRSEFSEEIADYLLLTLENKEDDVYVTNGCFWCWIEVPGGDQTPCTALLNSEGDLVGYVQTVEAWRSRLWFGHGSRTFNVSRNCSLEDWFNDGAHVTRQ